MKVLEKMNFQSHHQFRYKMNIKLLVTLFIPLMGYSFPVMAIDMNTLRQFSLDELMQVNVIGATLTDESLKSVPSAVTVFSRKQIEQMGFDYLHELLNLVPGYQSQRNAEYATLYSYSARGRRNGAQSKEVLLLMDGRIFNNPRIGSSNPVMLNLSQIERVEVIRGPGSALYGSGAYTGVVNVITRQDTNEVKVGVGAFNRLDGHVLATKEWNAWQFDIYAQADRDQGQSYNVDDNFNPDPSIRLNSHDPTKSAAIDGSVRYGDTRLRMSHRQQQTTGFYVIETLSEDFNQSRHEIAQVSLEQDIDWSNHFRSHLTLSWAQMTQYLDTQATAADVLAAISQPSSGDPLFGKVTQTGRYWQFKWHNDWQLSDCNSTQFGVEWIDNQETEASAANNFNAEQLATGRYPIDYYGNFYNSSQLGLLGSRRSFGIYGQYLHQFADDTKLTLGLRYDNYNEFDARLSPRMGLVHSLSPIHTVKLLYGEAFRAPTLNETGLVNNPTILGNPDLTHEIVKTWDAIWLIHTPHIYFSLGGFINYYDHPISTIVSNNIRTFANTASSEARGFELEANYEINDNWLLRGTLAHFSKLPDTAFRESDILASLLINYRKNNWNWNLTGIYHNEREMLSGNMLQSLDAYWLVNTKLRYDFNKSWSSYAQIKNVLDQDYQNAPQGNRLTEGTPNRGREWAIGAEYRF
jgi:outer membrane receptor protein involved in Fe transport